MRQTAAWIMVAAMVLGLASPAAAQEKRSFSAPLGWVGVATVAAGAALMVPWPEGEDWELFGENVCVIEGYQKFDIKRGTCDTWDPMFKAGLITAGIGAALIVVGFHKVSVRPTASWNGGKSIGAQASVKW